MHDKLTIVVKRTTGLLLGLPTLTTCDKCEHMQIHTRAALVNDTKYD